jgi:hypothetical protein
MKTLVAFLLLSAVAVPAAATEETPDAAAFRVMDEFLAAFNAKGAAKWADTLQFENVDGRRWGVRAWSSFAP